MKNGEAPAATVPKDQVIAHPGGLLHRHAGYKSKGIPENSTKATVSGDVQQVWFSCMLLLNRLYMKL